MPFIENIHNRHHIHACTVRVERVNVVIQCDKADIVHWKNIIDVSAYLNIIPAETAEVFHHDDVYLSCLSVTEQSLNTRSAEISPCVTVVYLDRDFDTK